MSPTPEEVLAHAIECVKSIEPAAQVERKNETSLMVQAADRSFLWNLADPMRLAPDDEGWREGVMELANRAFEQFRAPPSGQDVAMAPDNVVVLVWPQVKLDALGFKVVAEKLVDGLVLFYGVRVAGKVRSIKPEELASSGVSLEVFRQRAVINAGADAAKLEFGPLQEGAEIFTNHGECAVASSVLADAPFWRKLSSTMGAILVAVPAPSRLFLAPESEQNLGLLRALNQRSLEIENELLTTQILRFEGEAWSIVPTTS